MTDIFTAAPSDETDPTQTLNNAIGQFEGAARIHDGELRVDHKAFKALWAAVVDVANEPCPACGHPWPDDIPPDA